MQPLFKTLCVCSLIAASGGALAASTADLKVIGTIIPGSCTPTFAGGGTVDYGKISVGDLSPTTPTALAKKTIGYTIACDAAIKIGTVWVDGRNTSAYDIPSIAAVQEFGLGLQGANKVGAYQLSQAPGSTTADGAAVALISSADKGVTWKAATGEIEHSEVLQSYAATGTTVPKAYQNYTGSITVQATIAPTSSFTTSADVKLDGLATLEVRYL